MTSTMKGFDPQDLKMFDFDLVGGDVENPEVENRRYSRFPVNVLERVFTPEENFRLWFKSAFMCEFGTQVRESKAPDRIVWKTQNSMWRWGYKKDWNQVVRVLEGLQRFRLGNLEFRLDLTTGTNEKGRPIFHRTDQDGLPEGRYLFLDGTMGFVIYHKGKPVGVIGFSPVKGGVLFQQVQMFKPKGNRWLYKLEKPLFQMAAEAMCDAFSDCGGVFIVDGKSSADQIRRSYGNGNEGKLTDEAAAHIQAHYDQPLQGLRRGEKRTVNGTGFYRLEKV